MSHEQVRMLSQQLRLLGIHANAEHRAAQAMSEQLPPMDFLRLVLEDEVLARKNSAAKRLTARAHFRHSAALEDFDMSFHRGVTKAQLKELSAGYFLKRNENLLLFGKTGEGKTHLASALGHRLCADGKYALHVRELFV